mmetsp:Transcript_32078/g.79969  ORF Transcript_32078/g.79969 Transcript_32078/m.79969 type:complete len:126 (-) Transcript_32078:352-729(-)
MIGRGGRKRKCSAWLLLAPRRLRLAFFQARSRSVGVDELLHLLRAMLVESECQHAACMRYLNCPMLRPACRLCDNCVARATAGANFELDITGAPCARCSTRWFRGSATWSPRRLARARLEAARCR